MGGYLTWRNYSLLPVVEPDSRRTCQDQRCKRVKKEKETNRINVRVQTHLTCVHCGSVVLTSHIYTSYVPDVRRCVSGFFVGSVRRQLGEAEGGRGLCLCEIASLPLPMYCAIHA